MNVLSGWKWYFSLFFKFLTEQKLNCFLQNRGKAFETLLKRSRCEKRIFWEFENLIFGVFFADLWVSKCPVFEYNLFHFFAIIWVTKLKSFSRKVWQSVQIGLNLNFARGTIFESGFEATLKWKANTVTVWKWCFSYLCKFFSGEVKTVFWKNEEMLWKIFA